MSSYRPDTPERPASPSSMLKRMKQQFSQPFQQQPPQYQPSQQHQQLVQRLQQQPGGQASAEVAQLLLMQLAAAEQVLELGRKLASHLDLDLASSTGLPSSSADSSVAAPPRPGAQTPMRERSGSEVVPTGSDASNRSGAASPGKKASSLLEPLLRATGKRQAPAQGQVQAPMRQTSPAQESDSHAKAPQALAIFPDVNRLKELAKSALTRDEYNPEDHYRETGFCQWIARNEMFKRLTCAVIVLNALWIGVDTDWNPAPALYFAAPQFQIVENVFCSYFTFEILVRLLAFKKKRVAFGDKWFLFDLSLVVLMAWDTWIETALLVVGLSDKNDGYGDTGAVSVIRLLRLLRLSRVLRVGRLLKAMPEFLFLAEGVAIATRSVFSTLLLLLAVIYVFAIVFVQLLRETPAAKDCFENVPQAINCLFLNAALADQKDILVSMLKQNLFAYVSALLYFVIGSLTLMNMLIGVLCEVVSVVAREQTEITKVEACKEKMTALIKEMDADHDQRISMDEFLNIVVHPDMVRMLAELEVDIEAFLDHADILASDGRDVCDLSTFVDMALEFRESNGATVKDLARVRKDLSEIRSRLPMLRT